MIAVNAATRIRLARRMVIGVAVVLGLVGCGGDDDNGGGNGSGDPADTGGTGGTDATADTGTPDTGPPPGERLFIAYTREATVDSPSLPDEVQMVIVEEDCRPDSCDSEIVVDGDDPTFACDSGCQLTEDLSHIFFFDPGAPGTLRVAPLDEGFQLSASSSVVATDVVDTQIRGGVVAYRVGDDISVYDPNTGTSTPVGSLVSETAQNGGFYLADDGSSIFLNRVTLTTMTVSRLFLGGAATEIQVYRFISGEEQGTGSFYSGREQMAVSPDGTRLAVVTDARTSANECGSNADCVEPGQTCLLSANPQRCVRQELTLNVLNLEALDQLGQDCSADADCGADHMCDLSTGVGSCIPGRVLLGPSGPSACTVFAEGDHTDVRASLQWRNDREVAMLLTQECTSQGIPVTDIAAVNLDDGSLDYVYQNPGNGHGGDDCYDDVEMDFVPDQCFVEVDRMALSPSGATVAFVADSTSSANTSELWIADAFARTPRDIMTKSIDFDVISVSVHAR